jgi:superfamily II DNA or RNA helicase
MAKGRNTAQTVDFNDRLVLFKFFLSFFRANHLQDFNKLNHENYEGIDKNGNTRFYLDLDYRLSSTAFDASYSVIRDKLKQYDENICRHLKHISEKRGYINLKYFQYFSLLFTEMFLDRFFNDKDDFVNKLNVFMDYYRRKLFSSVHSVLTMEPYTQEKLNKLCFMCATGSGKTLIMHINILQFRHYNKIAGRHYHGMDINKTILLSPNEGMSQQHLEEFKKSNIPASLFQKDEYGFDFTKDDVLVIDMNKLKEEGKVKTVSVDSFEQNNLVLIDEAHRGIKGDVWYDYRNRLSAEGGFSFEYSATFKQALRASSLAKKEDETQLNEYGKSIIIDYSYKYFYNDGYGKDYRIYNLHERLDSDEQRNIYLTGCLLSFFQQSRLYNEYNDEYKKFEIENPLLVFVGNRVTTPVRSGSSINGGEKELLTDIQEILMFHNNFVSDKKNTLQRIKKVIEAKTNIVDNRNRDIFSQDFEPLLELYGLTPDPETIFSDILRLVFNIDTQSDSPRLYLIDIKAQGEIGLRIGLSGDFFGVINIGDTSNLMKQCEAKGLITSSDEISTPSLFRKINEHGSKIKVLIGSRKFTEGWNCWRVSTMGLINFAKGEGAQAIQLFGRGVRLHGYDSRLKRSGKVDNPSVEIPPDITYLETLTIFGIKADYMARFREYLEIEGLPPNADIYNYKMGTVNRFNIAQNNKLKVLKVKDGINFRKQARRFLLDIPVDQNCKDYFIRNKISLDCRTKVQGITSPGDFKLDYASSDKGYKIQDDYLQYIDYEYIYWHLQQYKSEKKYYNISLDINLFPVIMKNTDWEYGIIIPEDELKLNSIEKASKATSYIALVLQSYMDKYYAYHKNKWEDPYLVYQDISSRDPNFVEEYIFTYTPEHDNDTGYLQLEKYIKDLSELLSKEKVTLRGIGLFTDNIVTFDFKNHLFTPLVFKSDKLTTVQVSPVSLNFDERQFVYKLGEYLNEHKTQFTKMDIFLLRNRSKTGIGFFEAGNFYPDYILWIDTNDKQYMTFIDPKGLVYHNPGDPKIGFYQTIKELENRPLLQKTKGVKDVILNSFIFSGSRFAEIKNRWNKIDSSYSDKTDFARNHIIFLDHDDCIKTMFEQLIGV